MDDLEQELLALSWTPAALRAEKARVKGLRYQLARANASYAKKVRKMRAARGEVNVRAALFYLWYKTARFHPEPRFMMERLVPRDAQGACRLAYSRAKAFYGLRGNFPGMEAEIAARVIKGFLEAARPWAANEISALNEVIL